MAILNPQESFFQKFEPIQKNRFQILLPGVPPAMVSAVTIPTPTSNIIFIDHINVRFPVKAKTTFSPWSFSLYNAIAPSSLQILYERFRLGHESLSGRNGYLDIYSFDFNIQLLDPVNAVVSQFLVKDCVMSSFSGLEFDKSADGLVNITVTGECSSCELEF